MDTPFGSFGNICRMIKIEHSVFALPYAWAGSCLAAQGWPDFYQFFFLTLAMVAIRSLAMAFNRVADLPYDQVNPRTNKRPLVTGEISVQQTLWFCVFMGLAFILCCAALNSLCLKLALPAIAVVMAYSYLKRFTPLCHFWLGGSLGLAPIAGWISVSPQTFSLIPLLLFLAVMFWVAAFDIYYSFQDIEFDQNYGLHSAPVDFGPNCALAVAGFSHCMTVIFLFLAGLEAHLSFLWYLVWIIISYILLYEHKVMLTQDLRKINMVFFNLNGIISPVMLLGILLGIFV
ncbi:MAG: 4-hydroxybenzoate octaprenyltransferase [Desulfovibrionaceae bacterium]|nr:4-hydroxybenzoate octaprenyltransferase [Desulfovibrionaceae bacterium]